MSSEKIGKAELGKRKLSYSAACAVNMWLIHGSCGARMALQICPNLHQDDQTFRFPHWLAINCETVYVQLQGDCLQIKQSLEALRAEGVMMTAFLANGATWPSLKGILARALQCPPTR